MSRRFAVRIVLCTLTLTGLAGVAQAQDLLVRGATVHTHGAAGPMENTDVLVRGGKIAAVGSALSAPAGVTVVEAGGRPLTPGLFGGLSGLGLEEVSLEPMTVDVGLTPAAQVPPVDLGWRPEFDVTMAYNPRSAVIGVNRVEGLAWTVLAPSAQPGGSFVTGQGAAVLLHGGFDAVAPGTHTLFVDLGGETAALAGGSRAAQYMLLEQAIEEARSDRGYEGALLTPGGRRALARYLDGGRVVFAVDRAADIRQVLRLSTAAGFRPVIAGGAEAWMVAAELARAQVPVLLDPLVNLPGSFDQLGARLDNAARLHAAGVRIAFSQSGDATHNARKVRQLAGNAVANGLPWDAALAALTANPAQIFGLSGRGTIAPGQAADLVLWSGDPLEVTTWAEQVWIDGVAQPTRSRQTELLERYLPRISRP
ncbi:MAG TPA: amidohydrolase family protein [Xanthomonadaceae bacterium]|nr:amidohydrolase family protein [Xanthomonadaceae bacterium]